MQRFVAKSNMFRLTRVRPCFPTRRSHTASCIPEMPTRIVRGQHRSLTRAPAALSSAADCLLFFFFSSSDLTVQTNMGGYTVQLSYNQQTTYLDDMIG